ncbi:hypothetical protein BHE74_00049488 [Ensete ventricosum]|nr:hypothetical protein BHE74_00049488 [Ensete ventricosum]
MGKEIYHDGVTRLVMMEQPGPTMEERREVRYGESLRSAITKKGEENPTHIKIFTTTEASDQMCMRGIELNMLEVCESKNSSRTKTSTVVETLGNCA